ncbi:MAG: hypothetical protein WCD76_17690 [Pyrinomonadaceae bacterium]
MTLYELRRELFLAPMKNNFTFTRDELIALIDFYEARRTVSGQEAGWKLVPIEPTQAMIYAAADTGCCTRPTDTYAAMLDAAPTPERANAEKDAARYRKALEEIAKNDPFNQSSAGVIARAILAAIKNKEKKS